MQITIKASGVARQVDQDVLHQCKQYKLTYPESAAVIMALRDEVRRHVRDINQPEATITVDVTLSVQSGYNVASGRDGEPGDGQE